MLMAKQKARLRAIKRLTRLTSEVDFFRYGQRRRNTKNDNNECTTTPSLGDGLVLVATWKRLVVGLLYSYKGADQLLDASRDGQQVTGRRAASTARLASHRY